MFAFGALLITMLLEVDSVFPFSGTKKSSEESSDDSENDSSEEDTEVSPRRRGRWGRGFGLRYLSDD